MTNLLWLWGVPALLIGLGAAAMKVRFAWACIGAGLLTGSAVPVFIRELKGLYAASRNPGAVAEVLIVLVLALIALALLNLWRGAMLLRK